MNKLEHIKKAQEEVDDPVVLELLKKLDPNLEPDLLCTFSVVLFTYQEAADYFPPCLTPLTGNLKEKGAYTMLLYPGSDPFSKSEDEEGVS